MYMICMIHSNAHCLAHVQKISGYETFYYASIWTESVGLIGVNLFAMITGYVYIHSNWKVERYIKLWLTVAFYSIFLIFTGWIFTKFNILNYNITFELVLDYIFSLPFGSCYWYFVAYTGLFFFIPFINSVLNNCNKSQFIYLLVIAFVLIPFCNLKFDTQLVSTGYNFTWLAFMYAAGVYIKRFQPKFNNFGLMLICILCTLTPVLCRFAGIKAPLSYCMPNIILYSFCFFLLLYKVPFQNIPLQKTILYASQISFAVYLIHCHPTFAHLHKNAVNYVITEFNRPLWFAIVISIGVYISCAPLEYFRVKLFKICRMQTLSKNIAHLLERIFHFALIRYTK